MLSFHIDYVGGVSLNCPQIIWNPNDYAHCICSVSNTLLQFTVRGLSGSDETISFSSGDSIGRTRISGDFAGTLMSKTNGLRAIITFFATVNNSQIICENFQTPAESPFYNVTIKGIYYSIRLFLLLNNTLGAPSKTKVFEPDLYSHRVKIDWLSLSGAFRISYYIVKTSDNRTFNVNETSINIDFIIGDSEYTVTVTGVDITGNIGEESDPVFFTLDSELGSKFCQLLFIQILEPLNTSESVVVIPVYNISHFYTVISWQVSQKT